MGARMGRCLRVCGCLESRCRRCGVPRSYYANATHARRPSCYGGADAAGRSVSADYHDFDGGDYI